jgi:20S proteasome alpha/beta subunit
MKIPFLFLILLNSMIQNGADIFRKGQFLQRYGGLPMNMERNAHTPVKTILGQELRNHGTRTYRSQPSGFSKMMELRGGTTTLAFKFNHSVIVCVDSKASINDYVASRTVKKIIPVSKTILATMAGGAADCLFQIRNISYSAKRMKAVCDWKLTVSAVARMLAKNLRKLKGKAGNYPNNVQIIL